MKYTRPLSKHEEQLADRINNMLTKGYGPHCFVKITARAEDELKRAQDQRNMTEEEFAAYWGRGAQNVKVEYDPALMVNTYGAEVKGCLTALQTRRMSFFKRLVNRIMSYLAP